MGAELNERVLRQIDEGMAIASCMDAAIHNYKEIDFVDIDGQRFQFGLDADDGIFSLVLGPARAHGIQTLFVNGDEQYYLRPQFIVEMIEVPS